MSAWGKIADLLGQANLTTQLLLGSLVAIRVLPIIFQTPFLGGKLIPAETRIGLSLGLTLLVFPFAVAGVDGGIRLTALTYLVLLLKELFLGFVIGYVATELFYAMEIGGRAVDVMRGANQAEVQVPELQLRVSPIGQFNFQLLLVIFCALNGHGYFIESVVESFRIVPVDTFPSFDGGFEHFVDLILKYVSGLFGIAFALVFPGLFASFLTDVVFGMFNRIAPQLNAYFMAMGVKAMGGLFMFMVALNLMMGKLAEHLEGSLVFVRELIRLL
ncbi:MAG: flagellar biosynthetic protein FliR [Myxococcota bacterium]